MKLIRHLIRQNESAYKKQIKVTRRPPIELQVAKHSELSVDRLSTKRTTPSQTFIIFDKCEVQHSQTQPIQRMQ